MFFKRVIQYFRPEGTWEWAKEQMLNGKTVRCTHWDTLLVLKIEDKTYPVIMASYTKDRDVWNELPYVLIYETFTDYIIYEYEVRKTN